MINFLDAVHDKKSNFILLVRTLENRLKKEENFTYKERMELLKIWYIK